MGIEPVTIFQALSLNQQVLKMTSHAHLSIASFDIGSSLRTASIGKGPKDMYDTCMYRT